MLWWKEEYLLLKEEMRRALVSLRVQAVDWEGVAWEATDKGPCSEGQTALALRQASPWWGLLAAFAKCWVKGPNAKIPHTDDPSAIVDVFMPTAQKIEETDENETAILEERLASLNEMMREAQEHEVV